MKEIGLFFGSFNPIHIGHLIIANYVVENGGVDEVWMVVSPQNPFKKQASLLDEYQRLHLVNLAIEDHEKLRATDIEFKLEKPSFTGVTLAYLQEKYPDYKFNLIMGEDNLQSLHKWRSVESWIRGRKVLVYPRINGEETIVDDSIKSICEIVRLDAPLLKISASYIRDQFAKGQRPRYIVPDSCLEYIEEMNFYGSK